MNKKVIGILVCLVLAAGIYFAAGKTEKQETSSAEYKDTIVFAANTDILTHDPQVQNDTTSEQVVRMIYNTLLKFEDDGKVIGDLAESWGVSEDGLTWTIKLKQGVKFHNGKEVTAADAKATYERALNAKGGGFRTTEIIKIFKKMEAPDKYTLKITTSVPYGPMEALLCNLSLAVMDAEVLTKHGLELGNHVEAENGTGPYKLVSWTKGDEVKLERFDDYFGGKAPTANIIVKAIPEAASRVIALENGEVDVIGGISANDLTTLESNKNIKVLKRPTISQRLFRFGCNDPIIAKTKVRQAIVHAIDRQAIIDSMFAGTVYPSTAPLAPVTWGYTNLGEIKPDIEKAKALLKEAGYPNGFETKIVTCERYAKGVQMAEVLAAQLAKVGIKAKIEVWEWSALSASWSGVKREDFDQPMFVMGSGPSMRDADGGLRGLYTTTETGVNDSNYGFYSNKKADELIHAGMSETNKEKRAKLYADAQKILYLDDPAAFWLFDMYGMCAMSDKVEGVTSSPINNITFEKAVIKK